MENTNVTNDNNILNTDTEIIKRKDLVCVIIIGFEFSFL